MTTTTRFSNKWIQLRDQTISLCSILNHICIQIIQIYVHFIIYCFSYSPFASNYWATSIWSTILTKASSNVLTWPNHSRQDFTIFSTPSQSYYNFLSNAFILNPILSSVFNSSNATFSSLKNWVYSLVDYLPPNIQLYKCMSYSCIKTWKAMTQAMQQPHLNQNPLPLLKECIFKLEIWLKTNFSNRVIFSKGRMPKVEYFMMDVYATAIPIQHKDA